MRSSRISKIFAGKRCARFVGAHNGLGARLGEQAGFDGIWASGLEISASLGVPDANIVSSSLMCSISANIAASTTLPVMVDMDCGYGELQQVFYAVQDFARAGVNALCIEDKQFPKSNSFSARPQILQDKAQFAAKIRAAVAARPGPHFWIVARTEAFVAGRTLAEAVARANAYVDAGADAIVVQSRLVDMREIASFCGKWARPEPVIAIPTSYASVSQKALRSVGVRGIIYANHGLRSSIRAIQATFEHIVREGSSQGIEPTIASLAEVFELQGDSQIDRLIQKPKNRRRKRA